MDVVKTPKEIAQHSYKPLRRIARALGVLHRGFHHVKDRGVGYTYGAPCKPAVPGRDQIVALQEYSLLIHRIIFAFDPMQFTMKIEQAEIISDKSLFYSTIVENDFIGRVRLKVDQCSYDSAIG